MVVRDALDSSASPTTCVDGPTSFIAMSLVAFVPARGAVVVVEDGGTLLVEVFLGRAVGGVVRVLEADVLIGERGVVLVGSVSRTSVGVMVGESGPVAPPTCVPGLASASSRASSMRTKCWCLASRTACPSFFQENHCLRHCRGQGRDIGEQFSDTEVRRLDPFRKVDCKGLLKSVDDVLAIVPSQCPGLRPKVCVRDGLREVVPHEQDQAVQLRGLSLHAADQLSNKVIPCIAGTTVDPVVHELLRLLDHVIDHSQYFSIMSHTGGPKSSALRATIHHSASGVSVTNALE